MGTYSRGKEAYGFCDRCGFRYSYHELTPEYYNRKIVYNKVCPACHDPDHPQLMVGLEIIDDPKPLHDPRPDRSLTSSRSLSGWNPVGDAGGYTTSTELTVSLGTVTVSTS